MFDKDFFPTPRPVAQRMLQGINVKDKRILDPSAGKGDLLDFICEQEFPLSTEGLQFDYDFQRDNHVKEMRSAREKAIKKFFVIEKNLELQGILRSKKYTLLDGDFLAYVPEQRFDLIIMNPPFSDADSHLLKAIEISDGAEIRCLLPIEMLKNPYTKERLLLAHKLNELGAQTFDLGQCFQQAERSTNVHVVLVCIPERERKRTFEFKGNTYGEKQYTVEDVVNNQVERTDVFQSLVHRYNKVKELGHQMFEIAAQMRFYAEGLGAYPIEAFKASGGSFDTFVSTIRSEAWNTLYEQTKISGLVTSAVRKDLQESQAMQGNMAFTLENIEGLFYALVLNLGNIRSECILSAFDILTAYHPDNKTHVEGWKHNDAWMIRPKIIVPCGVSYYDLKDAQPSVNHEHYHKFQDIEKALCFVTGKEYKSIEKTTIWEVCSRRVPNGRGRLVSEVQWGEWIDTEFFLVKFFKKGTIHLKFKDINVCNKFNIEACRGKNWLPADYGKATV